MTLDQYISALEARDQTHINRRCDACTWYLGEKPQFHNRTYWSHSNPNQAFGCKPIPPTFAFSAAFSDGPRDSYWAGTFANLADAESAAREYGAVTELEFYCPDDAPSWFLIFNDFNKAARFCFENPNLV